MALTLIQYAAICGLAIGVAALVWDLARRRALAEKERRQLQPYALLGQGIESVAHDARHLLRAVRFTVERMPLENKLRELADLALEQVEQADGFLKSLGLEPETPQQIDAIACLRLSASLSAFRKQIDLGDVQGSLDVWAAPGPLSRVFANLLANAALHGGRARIHCDARSITIENPLDGPLPGDEIYERGRRGAKSKGRGLGLAVCREIAASIGATLSHHEVERGGKTWIAFALCFKAETPER
jgi:signal transduction histidine kinase